MRKYLFCKIIVHTFLCSFLLNGQVHAQGSNTSARIVGGSATNINSAKFTVNLRVNGQFLCGGSLVTPQFVITAAHCVTNLQPSQLTVVGGATLLSQSGTRRAVSKIITPREYNPRTYDTDVAVLKLSGNMIGPNISTIELCRANWKFGDSIDVYGWGALSEQKKGQTNQLRTVRVPLVTRKRCSDMYGGGGITKNMFCAGDLKGKDACFGDSGGPAVFENQLCGIVSFGIGCASANFPGIYTNIKSVRNFIDRAMKL